MTMKEMTSEQFAKVYEPARDFVLLRKIVPPKTLSSGIILTSEVVQKGALYQGVAKLLKKSRTIPTTMKAEYFDLLYKEGDLVAFGFNAPVKAPYPSNVLIKNPDDEDSVGDTTCTMDIEDIMGFYGESEEETLEFQKRIEEANRRVMECGLRRNLEYLSTVVKK